MINCIVAVDKSQGIGFNNQLPWPHLKDDMKWFKNKTLNNIVIMGSKTWESIGKPLPNRINIVISKQNKFSTVPDHVFNHPETALDFCSIEYPDKEIYIIGGESIYKSFLKNISVFYITEIDATYHCDRFFNLNWVKENFTKVIEHASFNDPINYKIKEYR